MLELIEQFDGSARARQRLIWDAIGWAIDQVGHFLHRDLLVVVNGRSLGEQLPPRELAAAARARGGGVLRLERSGPAQLEA